MDVAVAVVVDDKDDSVGDNDDDEDFLLFILVTYVSFVIFILQYRLIEFIRLVSSNKMPKMLSFLFL